MRRLGTSSQDLAIALEVESHVQRQFRHGHEANDLWCWLEERDRLDELPGALVEIGRQDLADVLENGLEEPLGEPEAPADRGDVPRQLRVRPGLFVLLAFVVVGAVVTVVALMAGGVPGRTAATSSPHPSGSHLPSSGPLSSQPTAPSDVTCEQEGSPPRVVLQWKAFVESFPGRRVVYYRISRIGDKARQAEDSIFYDDSVERGKTYTYTVEGVDSHSVSSAASRECKVTIK